MSMPGQQRSQSCTDKGRRRRQTEKREAAGRTNGVSRLLRGSASNRSRFPGTAASAVGSEGSSSERHSNKDAPLNDSRACSGSSWKVEFRCSGSQMPPPLPRTKCVACCDAKCVTTLKSGEGRHCKIRGGPRHTLLPSVMVVGTARRRR